MESELTSDDLVELRQLAFRYADAVDRRDGEAFRALFTEDGAMRVQTDDGPVENEWSGDGLAGSFDLLKEYRTFHHVGGAVFDTSEGNPTGRVQCMAHHYQRTGNGPVDLVMVIVYHDRYARPAGQWRIAERRVAIQWTELHPAQRPRR